MRTVLLASGLVALVVASGCGGPSKTVVKGKLTNNGKSILADKRGGVIVTFFQADDPNKQYPGAFEKEDDHYEVRGLDFKGIPHGKYKVSINLQLPVMTPDASRFNDRYSTGTTPVEVEVTGPQLDIDLAKFK
jgi:hypothetical protein